MPPAAPFLGRQEMEERTGQRGFPLCDSPTPGVNSARLSARLQIRCADSALPARASPLLAYRPFRSHARVYVLRRDGRHSLSVLPETGWKLSHSRSRSQAATADDLSSARRRREPRHAGGIPKGKALWLLLHTSGRAEVCPRRDREKSPTNSNLQHFLPLRRLLYQITFPSSTPEIRRLCRIDRKRPDFFHSTH